MVSLELARLEGRPNLKESKVLFSKHVKFLKGVVSKDDFPPEDRSEVCFAGRSNVGKSSLLNALTNQRSLARTSNTPGRTQQINYFSVDEKIYLVDLPGYGYAKAPTYEVEKWQNLAFNYLSERRNLKRIFLLIDIRHGPIKRDIEAMSALDKMAVSYQIVFTKCDKLKPTILEKCISIYTEKLNRQIAVFPELIVCSSIKKQGIEIIRSEIAKLC